MGDEDTKRVFGKFNYYFNDNDPKDQFNSKEKKFNNPHANLKINLEKFSSSSSSREKLFQERKSLYNNNEKKFSKLKLSSANNTNSSNSLNKHYRHVSSNNSTSNSSSVSNSLSANQAANQLKGKRTNSLLNFKY